MVHFGYIDSELIFSWMLIDFEYCDFCERITKII